jgi:hypothetical protein
VFIVVDIQFMIKRKTIIDLQAIKKLDIPFMIKRKAIIVLQDIKKLREHDDIYNFS